jgi:hypothetical protein
VNVIFLDIDGVLNTTRTAIGDKLFRMQNPGEEHVIASRANCFDRAGVGMILSIISRIPAKIVISSTWRFRSVMSDEIQVGDEKYNFANNLYRNLKNSGLLPFVHEDWRTVDLHRFNAGKVRGDEIQEWLSRHPEVKNYVIIDDDSDMLEGQQEHFVHVPTNDGILTEHFFLIEKILENSDLHLS